MKTRSGNEVNWIECTGEAHRISDGGAPDHCNVCAPHWEYIPVCPDCGSQLIDGERGARCPKCKIVFVKEA